MCAPYSFWPQSVDFIFQDFLEAFSSNHIWNLQSRGDNLRPGVSFQLSLGSPHFTVAISIPYLGVEEEIRPSTRNTQKLNKALGPDGLSLEILERLKGLTDFRGGRRLSWPRESSTLTQDRYPNVDNLQGNSVGEHFILVHRAGIVLLNAGASVMDDGGGKGMVDKGIGLLPPPRSNSVLTFHLLLQRH